MTKSEYNAAYSNARNSAGRLTREAMRELRQTYIDAADRVADAVRDAQKRGLSELTTQSMENIEDQLRRGASMIRDHTGDVVPDTVRRSTSRVTAIDREFMSDIVDDVAVETGITRAGLQAVATAVDDRVVQHTINRIWQDGYTLSERVWSVGEDYQRQIRRVLSAGLAQGRDTVEIARDIQVYVADGKTRLVRRYGELTADTKRFTRRIRRNVDYRALRLVRSELYASLQDAGREAGRENPGALDEYDWVMSATRQQWPCTCPELAAGGPYAYNEVPSYPHPNCRCRVQARLRDHQDFVNDLTAWVRGDRNVGYMDEWYRNTYLPAQAV